MYSTLSTRDLWGEQIYGRINWGTEHSVHEPGPDARRHLFFFVLSLAIFRVIWHINKLISIPSRSPTGEHIYSEGSTKIKQSGRSLNNNF